MNRLFQQRVTLLSLLAALFGAMLATQTRAQTCPFDDGNSSIAVEGLIFTRYALGLTGPPLVANTNINTVDAPTVEATINCPSCGLNITGNPSMTVADATIISRKLAGFSGAALTDSVNLGSGTRNTPAAVQSFLLSGCGATGGTITSITAGTGLTGGTITASGTIAADTAFLQRRLSSTCSAGSFITGVAADGTVSCGAPAGSAGGTVTNVATSNGILGGPITATGTLSADTAFLQRRVATPCAAGSFITSIAVDGTTTCATPPSGAGGTVTNVGTGAGLSGGPISTTGTIDLTSNQLLPTTACASGEVPKWSGSAWACAADAVGGTGTVTNVATSNGILGGPITATGTLSADTTFLQRRVASTCAVGSAISAIAADGTVSCEVTGQPNAFVQGGNSFGAPSVIGTTDGQPLTVQSSAVIVNMLNSRGDGLRVEHRVGADFTNAPATINGHRLNSVAASASGGTIAGGGYFDGSVNAVNTVTGGHGSIGGGANNSADFYGTVSGGSGNSAGNTATVAGGAGNTASGPGSIVAGGQSNTASGFYSFAAGTKAVADRRGSFVWSDNYSFTLPFRPSVIWASPFGDNTFNVRAVGGVMFATSVNATTGAPATYCYMGNSGTGWICSSDRNVKEHVQPIQPSRVLAGVLAMPVSTWSIIGSKVRQMGPMAQDFYRAFGLGDTDKAINSIDSSGVAFAAIQGLNRKLTDEVKALHAKLSAKDHEAGQLKARLAAIEKKLGL